MILSERTLEELRKIINADDTEDYRSGPQLVKFFNDLGFNDSYGRGFPSRWMYTDDKLQTINGTPALDECIRKTFSVIDYLDRLEYLDLLIERFNRYLAFDKWQIERSNEKILFNRLDKIIIDDPQNSNSISESNFLKREFDISITELDLEQTLLNILDQRMIEAESCIKNDLSLSAIFLIGSIMEGILLGMATHYPSDFNQASSAPKYKDGRVKMFSDWRLSEFLTVSHEIGVVNEDVMKFSHAVRDFRNYIHPYQQMCSGFRPDEHTAIICFQVLKAMIAQVYDFTRNS